MPKLTRKIIPVFFLAMLATVSFAVTSCDDSSNSSESAARSERPSNPMTISPREFHQAYSENPEIKILDVRTRGEYDNYHVQGGVLVPVEDIMGKGEAIVADIPFAREDKIYLICQTGNRSLTAARILRSMGYEKAVSVNGGHSAFMRLGNTCESGALACR